MMDALDILREVRVSLCRDCKGTGFGKWECTFEKLCDGFKQEVEEIKEKT